MSWTLVVLCAAASALIAFATSAALGIPLAIFRSKLAGLTAAAEARVLFGIVLLPMLVCVALMMAALSPSFGWIMDHCAHAAAGHAAHPHICTTHHVSVLPALTLWALAALLALRVSISALQLLRASVAAHFTSRALARISERSPEAATRDVQVLPFAEPQAFVVGALDPALFVTKGLLSDAHCEHLPPALAHERAHLRRRDPLRRLVAILALGFHLPGLAAWLERRLARAHEMAADADAARELDSPERVARALVRLTRAQRQAPRTGLALTVMAFGQSDVEARVASLLDRRPRRDRPGLGALLALVALLFAITGASAETVHHGVEIVLGLLS